MRKIYSIICVVCLLLLIPAILRARSMLPLNAQPLIEEKYAGWAGVLRIWVCETWQTGSGSCSAWLNRCISSYEKRHSGVYIQPEYVSGTAIAQLGENGIAPPDMILFPSNVLEDLRGLIPVEGTMHLRDGLNDCGLGVAAPVLMGGYLWTYNTSLLPDIPATWQGQEVEPAVLPDDDRHLWSAALLALSSSGYVEGLQGQEQRPNDLEIDLGLAASATVELSCALPEGFAASEAAWRDFINGDAAALVVTQREVRRLQALSDQGKGPEWRLASTGADTFSDQVMFASIVDRGSSMDAPERQALCQQFIQHLLSDACQGELYRVGAFSVTDAPSGYSAGDPLSTMEATLRASAPVVPPCAGSGWQRDVQGIVRNFTESNGDPRPLWRQATRLLRQKPNIHIDSLCHIRFY